MREKELIGRLKDNHKIKNENLLRHMGRRGGEGYAKAVIELVISDAPSFSLHA